MRPRAAVLAIFAALLLTLGLPAATQESDYSHARVVRLSQVEGDVQVHRTEAGGWERALANLPLRQGYALSTGYGRAEIEFESGATAWLADNTTLDFTELALAGGARITRLGMSDGTATFYANLSRLDIFVVTTPHLTARIPDDARFRLDVRSNGTWVGVLKGDVEVETRDATTHRVTKNRTLFVGTDAQAISGRLPQSDAWDRWVSDRSETVYASSRAASRYVNAPFSYGMADLAYYGTWLNVPGYGRAWQPYGLSSSWTPYWHGRWVYLAGIGWTWVSYEPWGWLPYHYGRWVHTSNVGWVWLPINIVAWHPGLVLWFQFGNQVGWCPLGVTGTTTTPTPTNTLPPGTVVNTVPGVMTGAPNQRPGTGEVVPAQWSLRPPLREFDLGDRGRLLPGDVLQGEDLNPAPAGVPATRSEQPTQPGARPAPEIPSRYSVEPRGIVYDPREGRYVNNPAAPARSEVENRRGEELPPPPPARGYSGTVMPPPGRTEEKQRPTEVKPGVYTGREPSDSGRVPPDRGVSVPQRPSVEMRGPAERQPSSTTNPRTDAPRPAPVPRGEMTPSSPPPRTEAPRPAPSTPRAEPPRPTPPPRAEPRPTPPPTPKADAPRPPSPPPTRGEQPPPKPPPKPPDA